MRFAQSDIMDAFYLERDLKESEDERRIEEIMKEYGCDHGIAEWIYELIEEII